MNIGQIYGTGGIDHSLTRSGSKKPGQSQREQAPVQDSARISDASRDTLRVFEGISGRLNDDAGARQSLVAEVKGRLQSGSLDQGHVYREVARSILSEE